MKSQIARKIGVKQSEHVAEWSKQNEQGGSKIFRNLGKVVAATTPKDMFDAMTKLYERNNINRNMTLKTQPIDVIMQIS